MTQEEKELLIRDLVARICYKVCAKQYYSVSEDDFIIEGIIGEQIYAAYNSKISMTYPVEKIKPYLRPMSSMTDEEKEELRQEHIKDEKLFAECLTKAANGDSSMRGKVVPHFAADWCNKNHFDYRGLIPMGLALKAPEDMYNTKIK